MATDSDGKLTKFESSVTVVTAELANSLFGGLYGTSEVASKDTYHPLAHGHVHDGEHIDGHASPVSLSEPYHIRGVLVHDNLGDDAVMKNNVFDSIYQDDVIPEYEEIGGEIRYYLDLRSIRSDFIFREVQDPAGDRGLLSGAENKLIRQRKQHWDGSACADIADIWEDAEPNGYDFVFGSESLEDLDLLGAGDNRFLFDKSKGAFRAGGVEGTKWDNANRGNYSVAFGKNTKASGNKSAVGGGENNEASGIESTVSGGDSNKAEASNSTIGGGQQNEIDNMSTDSTIGGGTTNIIDNGSLSATIGGGFVNKIDSGSVYSIIGGGFQNKIIDTSEVASTTHSVVSGGGDNKIDNGSTHSTIGGGTTNTIDNASIEAAISGGSTNVIDNGSSGSCIGGGNNNTIDLSGLSTLSGGQHNKIDAASSFSAIAGGGGVAEADGNYISGALSSFIGGGTGNTITDAGSVIGGGIDNTASGGGSTVGGGANNSALGDYSVVSGGGGANLADRNSASSPGSFVGGGRSNDAQGSYSVICGGDNNEVSSDSSVIVGGNNNDITGNSQFSIIAGGGGAAGEGNAIGVEYITTYSGLLTAPPTPSPVSGIFGGKKNRVVGGLDTSGNPVGEFNFIIGGLQNGIGAVEGSVESCYILGGTQNDIIASQPVGSVIRNSMIGVGDTNVLATAGGLVIDYCAIFSGLSNLIEVKQNPGSEALFCTILNGHENKIITAGQTSSIIGGSNNEISSASGAFSSTTTATSTIIGGYKNKIDSCHGSIIGGGGTQIDPLGNPLPPYTIAGGSTGNEINNSHYTSILGGSSNKIDEQSHFSTILSGEDNLITNLATWSSIPYGSKNIVKSYGGTKTSHASAAGLESCSYTFGQDSLSSGNFDVLGDTYLQTYAPNPAIGTPGVYGGNTLVGETGGAQSFILNAFGHWRYLEPHIVDPASSPNFGEYVAYFDGNSVMFQPRENSVYSFNLHCVLSFTEAGAANVHHFISFDYKGGISVGHDGVLNVMHYGAGPIFVNHNSSAATISNTAAADFQVRFTHDFAVPVHEVAPGAAIALSPMAIWVKNTSNPGTWTASSLSVRAEFVECRLYYRGFM